MLHTGTISRNLTELSPRPWTLCFRDRVIRDAAGRNIASIPKHADLDWIVNAPALVEMLVEEIVRLQRQVRRTRRRGYFHRERGSR